MTMCGGVIRSPVAGQSGRIPVPRSTIVEFQTSCHHLFISEVVKSIHSGFLERSRSVTKSVRINRREPQNSEAVGPPHWGGDVAEHLKTSPAPHALPYQIWWFCINRREPPKLGSTGAPPPCGMGMAGP